MTERLINVPCVGWRNFSFDPRRTAFISVDMQHDFVADAGACGAAGLDMTLVQAVIPNLQRVLASMRSGGVTVVHTRYGFKPDLSNLPESVRRQSRDAGQEYGTAGPMGRILVEGEEGFAIIPQMTPRAGEIVIDKATFGAFAGTDLHEQLLARHITHLVIGGVTTQCCVEGTLREAIDRGYYCLTLYDGSAAFEPELHEGTMRAIQSEGHLFGWIGKCDDVVAAIRAATEAEPDALSQLTDA